MWIKKSEFKLMKAQIEELVVSNNELIQENNDLTSQLETIKINKVHNRKLISTILGICESQKKETELKTKIIKFLKLWK